MNLGADMVRNKPQDAFAVAWRQTLSGIEKSTRQPIDPEPAVRIEHDLDDGGVFKPERNRRAKRRAQHAGATRRRLLIELVDCHFRPQTFRLQIAVVPWGSLEKAGRAFAQQDQIRCSALA